MNATTTISDNISGQLEKVRQLERRHVEVHLQLLKALDELYLTKEDRQNFVLTREQEARLEDRHMLQMSLEKGIAISKAIKRNLQESQPIDKVGNVATSNADVDGHITISTTSEDRLASELIKLSEDNFSLDFKLIEALEPVRQLSQEYNKRRQEFEKLKSELNQLISDLPLEETSGDTVGSDNNNNSDPLTAPSSYSTDVDIQMERENTTLVELITALTHLSRRMDT